MTNKGKERHRLVSSMEETPTTIGEGKKKLRLEKGKHEFQQTLVAVGKEEDHRLYNSEEGTLDSVGYKTQRRKEKKRKNSDLKRHATVEKSKDVECNMTSLEKLECSVNDADGWKNEQDEQDHEEFDADKSCFADDRKAKTDIDRAVSQEDQINALLCQAVSDEEGLKGEKPLEEGEMKSRNKGADIRKKKKRKRWLEEAAKAERRGICYLSRIPPKMDHVKLRQILSQHGEIQRIYLAPEDPAAQIQRKRAGGFRGQRFSEGWVEFTDKHVAKRVANMLNCEQIGGKKRSPFFYDIWNIKYLSKFKWDDLTEEIAYKNAIREQKLALEISAAKKERDSYLSKVDKSRALSSIEERMKKKQKIPQDSGINSDASKSQDVVKKVFRQFPQNKPVANDARPGLSKDVLAGVFGGS